MANGDPNLEFDVRESNIFSASMECLPKYRTTDKIECKFHLKNNGQQDYSVLKWRTPLDGMTSNCLDVVRAKKEIPYDGIYINYGTQPGPNQFVLVKAGQTVSSTIDVSEGYDMSKRGKYSVNVDTYLQYAVGSVSDMEVPIPVIISPLTSPDVSFRIIGKKPGKGTRGQRARSLERENKRILLEGDIRKRQSSNVPPDPVVKGNAAQKAETKEVHRAAYHYIASAIPDVQTSPNRVDTWFGTSSVSSLVQIYQTMEGLLRSDTMTYVHDAPDCEEYEVAYTFTGTRTLYLCPLYESFPSLLGYDSKMGTIVHELSHALAYTDDIVYGISACKWLAQEHPSDAANNADNYQFFVTTSFPFNYGIDAMTTLSNGHIFAFKGNFYARYTDSSHSTLNPAYPELIQGRFGNLPDDFAQGFDSFSYLESLYTVYATKGDEYIAYADASATTIQNGYPKPLDSDWGVSGEMGKAFQSLVQVPVNITYATNGPIYVRYTDPYAYVVDPGYPKTLDSGEWGNLPQNFKSSFDAMALLPDGKLYVFKDSEYLRYSNPPSSQIDAGYPLPIKGNWGNVPQP
ncbi:hypothetical protein ACROYT_G028111 [Oculina patagonica]